MRLMISTLAKLFLIIFSLYSLNYIIEKEQIVIATLGNTNISVFTIASFIMIIWVMIPIADNLIEIIKVIRDERKEERRKIKHTKNKC